MKKFIAVASTSRSETPPGSSQVSSGHWRVATEPPSSGSDFYCRPAAGIYRGKNLACENNCLLLHASIQSMEIYPVYSVLVQAEHYLAPIRIFLVTLIGTGVCAHGGTD
jgi:hypothetical protein